MSIHYFGDIALASGSAASFHFGKSKDKDQHTQTAPEQDDAKAYIPWGEDNQYPQHIQKALQRNGAASAGLRVLRATHYGQGFQLYRETAVDGKRDKQHLSPYEFPEIAEFFKTSKLPRFWTEIIADLELYHIAFPEFVLSKDYSRISSLRRLQAAKVRYARMSPKSGLIEQVYFCHHWSERTDLDSPYVTKIPVVDSYWSAEQIRAYCKAKKIRKFVLPIFQPLTTQTYYPQADWHAIYHNGWLEVANSIPQYKKYLFENQINLKYMVYIAEEYFLRNYQDDWHEFTPEKKQQLRQELTTAIDAHLSGNKNAGKSIQSVVYKDSNGDWVKGIEVTPIDDVLKDGSYLPEASAANSEIMFAMGVDPSIVGAGIPGGKMNSGSGSDKREAYLILTALFKTKREITLEPWRLIRDYNGWPAELQGGFANTVLTTLDKNPMGMQVEI